MMDISRSKAFPFRRANRDNTAADPGTPAQAVASFIQAKTAYHTDVSLRDDGAMTVLEITNIPQTVAQDVLTMLRERLPQAQGHLEGTTLTLSAPKIDFEGFSG